MKALVMLVAFTMVVVCSPLAHAQDDWFAPPVNYGVGEYPQAVSSADLDNDGDFDLAVANWYSDNVSILLNNGDGTFQSAVNYGTVQGPYSVFSADFDNDGDFDLALPNIMNGVVAIFRNNGNGTFQSPSNYGAGTAPVSVFAADLDGDSDFDLAVANTYSNNVSVLRNNGNGTFQTRVNYGVGDSPWSVFAADLDGDGDNDLAVANEESDNISILRNNGNGTFQGAVNYASGSFLPSSIFAEDFDNDGDLDLSVANGNNISILSNNGNATFQAAVNYSTGGGPRSVFAGDFNGDGNSDLAVANGSYGYGTVSILRNNGDGTFQAAVNYLAGDDTRSVFAADLDGDNDLDLAASNFNSYDVSILINLIVNPEVVSTTPGQNELNVGPASNIEATFNIGMDESTMNSSTFVASGSVSGLHGGAISYDDFSKTALIDPTENFSYGEAVSVTLTDEIRSTLGALLTDGYVWSYTTAVNLSTGSFIVDDFYTVDGPGGIFSSDLDGDGDLDIAVNNNSANTVSTMFNNGNGTFSAPVSYPAGNIPYGIFSGDYDNDGDMDLAVSSVGDWTVSVLMNNGDGTFAPRVTYALYYSAFPNSVFGGDLNGDGYLDLVTANVNPDNVSVLLNNGDGTFRAAAYYGVGNRPRGGFASDLDNDGDLDLAIANRDDIDLSVLLNNGNGTFAPKVDYAVVSGPGAVFAGDLDGDGDNDLATSNPDADEICILKNNGDGTFTSYVDYTVGDNPSVIIAGDYDGDGDIDLITPNNLSNDISVVLNNGDGTFAPHYTYPAGTAPGAIFASDFDGDGDLDLSISNNASDALLILLNVDPPGFIMGSVINHISEGIAGVLVEAITGGSPVGSDSTDENGNYEITDLPAGSYDVSFAAEGFYDTLITNTEVTSGDTTTVDMMLHRPGSYSGTVTDFYGSPLQDVHVLAGVPSQSAGIRKESDAITPALVFKADDAGNTPVITDVDIISETWTDASGDYALILDPGIYAVTFDTAGWDTYITVAFAIALDTVITNQDVLLRRPGSISGTVSPYPLQHDTLDISDYIEGVHVAVIGDFFFQEDYTDDEGQYLIEGVYDGDYEIIFSHPDYDTVTIDSQHVNDGEELVLDVFLLLSGCQYLPGDANMSAGIWPPQVIGSDVTYLVSYFRGINVPCLLGDPGFFCAADANGDCQVIGSDVTKLVTYFRGLTELGFCAEYSPAWMTPDALPETAPDGWPGCGVGYQHEEIRGECLSAVQDSGYMVLEAIGNDLHIYHMSAFYNCCMDYVVDYEFDGFNITAYESDVGEPCDCLCYFNLESMLYDLGPGTYTVTLIGVYGDTIGEDTITIGGY